MTTSLDAHTRQYSHINGSDQDRLERLAVSELCKGWPVYRDASEWKNYRSLFAEEATIWTTWSKAQPIDNFINISKKGKDRGDFIMHRECGTLVEYAPDHSRAVGKMKATITQRFKTQPCNATPDCPVGAEYDVDCDCRFIFFCFKDADADGAWKAKYVKLFYEKDKVVPVDGNHAPIFDRALLQSFPDGYKFLGAAQSSLGYPVGQHLPTARNHQSWCEMYIKMEEWLSGHDVDLYCCDDVQQKDTLTLVDIDVSCRDNAQPANGAGPEPLKSLAEPNIEVKSVTAVTNENQHYRKVAGIKRKISSDECYRNVRF
ncbi:uncharacterized protein BCR38DRAFT_423649 [Pseudomassariella vexata]|uniref:SnoaL-like domain-containing protein n=1 Tax=Pseudomassariella vexata TaxID=1141098 RepID=A0A1Y2EAI5_9PEZI|nr:uncharacterized protein BCR38DRAFT_423649 [Pseudomassariella vexata]ORY68569.1 hypothetical protein BCR38DRAFT_423649 [Pseudomassariella vexata]